MAYSPINKGSSFQNNVRYVGTGSSPLAITGVGFEPDLTWIKKWIGSTNEAHMLSDQVRGYNYRLTTTSNAEQQAASNDLLSWQSDGFTVGSDNRVNQSSSYTYAGWNWKAETTASGSTTGSGTAKTYSSSSNSTAGFSIVKYTGNGTGGHQIPHGCGSTPSMIIVKRITGGTGDWYTYHEAIGNQKIVKVNYADAESGADISFWNDTSPNATTFTVGSATAVNYNNSEFIAYCWSNVTGYCRAGTYTGNGNSGDNAPFINIGFKPSWIVIKKKNGAGSWWTHDNKFSPVNVATDVITMNSESPGTNGVAQMNILSNGFKLLDTTDAANGNGGQYIYLAFGQPLVGSNNIPNNAR